MMRSVARRVLSSLGLVVLLASAGAAQTPLRPAASPSPSASPAPLPGQPPEIPYDRWTQDAKKQEGLFTLWRRDGRVYIELRPEQFERDFLQTAVPANGLGGYGILSGDMFQQEGRLVRFTRDGRRVAMVWPQTRFVARPDTPLAEAVRLSTADSVAGMLPIVTEDKKNGGVVLDPALLLGDVMDLTSAINRAVADPHDPATQYHLDPARSYFGPSKAFPANVVIEADQTFTSAKPPAGLNTVVDPRSIQMRVAYNLVSLPGHDGYMPRLYDDRVGFWEDPHIAFDRPDRTDPYVRHILRWNMQPSDPSKALSPAKKPIVYTLSNTIPVEYRDGIRRAILTWNKAFERIGISDAIRVQDQPSDPAWDPDDVRYNVVRWLTEANRGGFAKAQIVWDPRTGEILRGGVLIDSDLLRFDNLILGSLDAPKSGADETLFASEQLQYGAIATALMTGADPFAISRRFANDLLYSFVLHEVGHDFGLAHNFIAYTAYSRKQIRDKAFTSKYGITSSVMAYPPPNIAPKGVKNGDLLQMVLGPYDYHAIHWGYARIPGASTPEAEVPTLDRWASVWSDPRYRFASDEDVAWSGHAIDPRVHQFLLTNDPIGWCDEQLGIVQDLLTTLDRRLPLPQRPYADERLAFGVLLAVQSRCASSASHFMGGEYLSRSRVGDPHAAPPLTPVSREEERRAFAVLDRHLFSNEAWRFSPATLRRLVYTEHEAFLDFGSAPPPRHDVSVADVAGASQSAVLSYMFAPLVLARIADLPTKAAPGSTMTLADLFAWTQTSIYGDLANGAIARATQVRRNLQRRYAALLAKLATAPAPGTPYDAQALARHELEALDRQIGTALGARLDLQAQAHLEAMRADVRRALSIRTAAPPG